MTDMSQADLVIERFGGIERMADLTGHPAERIRNWKRVGRIPQQQHYAILRCAQAHRILLLPHDLVAHLVTQLIAAAQDGDTVTPTTPVDVAS